MSGLHAEEFEPALLHQEGPARLTEWGKRYMSARMEQIDKCWGVMRDIMDLAHAEQWKWAAIECALAAEGVPTAVTSGLSQYAMDNLLPHVNGKTSFTMPATRAAALVPAKRACGSMTVRCASTATASACTCSGFT